MQTTNKHLILILLLFLVVNIGCNQQQKKKETAESKNVAGDLDRTVLPIKEPIYPAQTELDARNAKKPERFEVTAPKGAPNVLVVLIDDQGFGVSNAFGGPVQEPVLDKMASEGLRYNNFNTTALCSPTRTAILTG